MIKLFFVEIKKTIDPRVWLSGLFIIVFLTVIISVLELKTMPFGSMNTFFVEYMLYNLTFLPVKIMLPSILILMTASIFANEYSSGLIKSFLICGIKRQNLYFAKVLFLLLTCLLTTMITFFILSGICAWTNGFNSFTNDDYLRIMQLYILAGIGMLPIILLTILFSQLFGEFERSVVFGLIILVLSLTCDSIGLKPFYTPTGFLSHSNLLYYNNISNYWYAIIVLISYLIIANVLNLFLFTKKDIWH